MIFGEQQLRFVFSGEVLAVRMHETTAHTPHIPTKAELEAQVRHDEWHDPSTYPDGTRRTLYPKRDYQPSGTLRLDIYDPAIGRYGQRHDARFVERKVRRLEARLNDIMAAFAVQAEITRARRLDRENIARRAAQEAERRRMDAARAERIARLDKVFDEAAKTYTRLLNLEALRQHLCTSEPAKHSLICEELDAAIARTRSHLSAGALSSEIIAIPDSRDLCPVSTIRL